MRIINDFIHMTPGELLVHYWWLWALMLAGFIVFVIYRG